MAYTIVSSQSVPQAIADTSTRALLPVGTVVKAVDPIYGEGEFVYALGVASTVVGSVAAIDQRSPAGVPTATVLTVAATRGPVGVAMSANVAGQYGWYQVSGSAVVKTGTVAAAGIGFSTATPGQLDDAVVTGSKIDGIVFKSADGTPSAGLAVAQIARPSANGNG